MTPPAFEDRFISEPNTGCWLWISTLDRHGYGVLSVKNKTVFAHRFSYQRSIGPIPDGLTLDHLCRVRSCVNPVHLQPISSRENVLRGEGTGARNARKTHCLVGHEFNDENKYINARGERQCRPCNAKRHYDRYHQKENISATPRRNSQRPAILCIINKEK